MSAESQLEKTARETCALCGSGLRAVARDMIIGTGYRCSNCHAGGRIIRDQGSVIRLGDCFNVLNNYVSRQARAATRVEAGP